MKPIVETENLGKEYGQKKIVANLDLKIPEHSIYGFLGPNGAGKSTTMKMILGLVKPSAGQVKVCGTVMNRKNRLEILKKTGSLIETPSYYGHLTGRENLEIIAELKQVPAQEIDEVLETVRMENQQNKKAGQYSLGMKQRLGLAGALLGKPGLLLLDEPTNGLDPAGIQEMRELIKSLPKRYGMTVMISSHLLGEIDLMATHVGIINQGELIFQDTIEHLHEYSKKRIRLRTLDDGRAVLRMKDKGISVHKGREGFLIPDLADEVLAGLVRELSDSGIGVLRIEEYQKNLEDIFLDLTGKGMSL
ncbi:ATP-binding cassette domain-containing protein [Clostridium sp. MCC353]|uniref:ATP-binding cassette domain-containing protein n=1 Tax=Clostridium sp. MCC353 TaxID=2592646 RepID=UPI001C01D1A7|nr:ABC transporter ATP-binding protein [Clostridium sp. MCC353]MBT9775042.1 ATP-binding cassette domain-containing protein [Clostridium sp. MCC353]